MTKFVVLILLLIATFTVSAWFIVLIPVLMFREIIVYYVLHLILRRITSRDDL